MEGGTISDLLSVPELSSAEAAGLLINGNKRFGTIGSNPIVPNLLPNLVVSIIMIII